MNKKFKIFFFIMIIIVCVSTMRTYYHEEAHKEIYRQFGCTDIFIDYKISSSRTYATCNNMTDVRYSALRIAQANIESNYEDNVTDFLLITIILILMNIYYNNKLNL